MILSSRPPRRYTALIGDAPDCARVVLHLRRARRRLARFDTSPYSLSLLCDAVREGRVTEAVAIGADAATERRLREVLGGLDLDISLYVSPLDGVRPASRLFGILPVRPVVRRPIPPWGRVVKAGGDRLLALALLALFAPVMLGAAGLIRLDGAGPVVTRQWREGRNGAAFPLLRFRRGRQGLARSATRGLAALRLDALPQLVNVLRGEMSLVGPPPHAVAMRLGGQAPAAIAPHYPCRHRVRPGLTGLAQLAAPRAPETAEDLRARLALDLAYIRAWSPGLDLKLLLLTPWRMARRAA